MATLLLPNYVLLLFFFFFFFFLHLSSVINSHVVADTTRSFSPSSLSSSSPVGDVGVETHDATTNSPFTAKAALIRYWNRKVPTNRPLPAFMLSKLSPLSALESTTFSSLAASGPAALSTRLPALCSAAHLLCLPDRYDSFMTSDEDTSTTTNMCFLNYFICSGSFGQHLETTASTAGPEKKSSAPNQWLVEPGKFFRESELRKGNVMSMPDIRDNMAPRSFLPRSISGRIPLTVADVRRVFNTSEDTAMGKAIADTVATCASSAPSRGETNRCVTSAEDLIDFAVSMLGKDVVVRSTASSEGAGGSIAIGEVTGVNGGNVTRSVSCHQVLFPYLVYYCHSTSKVRVYEAEILAVDSKQKINHGVAICHLDTSEWSPRHAAFMSLGSAPGKIEVCHWIFQGDMTWAVAD